MMYKSQFKKIYPYDCFCGSGSHIGLGTELGTFKGTDRIASVLPSIDSH